MQAMAKFNLMIQSSRISAGWSERPRRVGRICQKKKIVFVLCGGGLRTTVACNRAVFCLEGEVKCQEGLHLRVRAEVVVED